MILIKEEKIKKAFDTKPYPFKVTKRIYDNYPDVVKELGWTYNLHSEIYTHYFKDFVEFIEFVVLIYGGVKVSYEKRKS